MKVLILGSGVIGVTSAWYLATSGHDVTVIDKETNTVNETNFANAGQISPSYSAPWTAPGIPVEAIKWLIQNLAPLKINSKELDTDTLVWMTKMAANCNTTDYQPNKSRMIKIAEYSRHCLQHLTKQINIEYHQKTKGTLQIFRSEKQLNDAKKELNVLTECGIDLKILSKEECLAFEPALRHSIDKISGGIHLPNDENSDCQLYITHLVKECKKLGVTFVMDTCIEKLNKKANGIINVATDKGLFTADAYLMALGSYSTNMLANIGIKVPVYPITGYSLTLPIQNEEDAPKSTIMDDLYKVAISRLGNRINVSGASEISEHETTLLEKRRKIIASAMTDIFPNATVLNEAAFSSGLRAMTPDGSPILGKTNIDNLYLNIGHGTLGWTTSLGAAKIVSDIINDTPLEIDDTDFSVERYDY